MERNLFLDRKHLGLEEQTADSSVESENTEVEKAAKFTAVHDAELHYTHYIQGDSDRPEFELLLGDEARQLLTKLGWKKIKSLFTQELNRIELNPWGDTSIDPQEGKITRSLNRLSAELEECLQKPIAIKGSGIEGLEKVTDLEGGFLWDGEELMLQYRTMLKLDQEIRANLTATEQAKFRICQMFGVIRYPISENRVQEWLIMERISDFKHVHDLDPSQRPSILALAKFPELAALVNLPAEGALTWKDFSKRMALRGIHFSDIGRNVLVQEDSGGNKSYVVIDQLDDGVNTDLVPHIID